MLYTVIVNEPCWLELALYLQVIRISDIILNLDSGQQYR